MKARKVNPEKTDRDNPEWSAADFARAKPFSELPKDMQKILRNVRGPQKSPTKKLVSLRLSANVVAFYKATGPGWQTRIDDTLQRAVKKAAR